MEDGACRRAACLTGGALRGVNGEALRAEQVP
jgi:hypothetical protein